ASPRSATECHRRFEVSGESNRAVSGWTVDHNSRCRHANTVLARGIATLCVYRSSVPHTSVSKYLSTPITSFLEAVNHVVSENGGELLHRQRIVTANSRQLANHCSRAGRNLKACHFSYDFGILAHDFWVKSIRSGCNHAGKGLLQLSVEEISSL